MDTESHSSGSNIEVSPCMRVGDNAKVCAAIPIISDADRQASSSLTPSPDAEGRVRLRDPGLGIGEDGDPMFTLQATKPHAVAFKPSHYTRGKDGQPNDITPPLSADADKGDQDTVIAIDGANQGFGENVHHSLRTGRDSGDGVAFAFAQNQLGEVRVNSDVMGTVNQNQNASGRNTPMIAQEASGFSCRGSNVSVDGDIVGTMWTSGQTAGGRINVQHAMQVRRLCPSECEALQGFPIGYTDIPYRNKPAADGPRYRALGNSMAVPCMWWLGHRIDKATRQDTNQ